jgi:Raf kinase inhibitor-like YbhB/YbcL family protein
MGKNLNIFLVVLSLICISLIWGGCGSRSAPTSTAPPAAPSSEIEAKTTSFALNSTAFDPDQPIPVKYTCDGEDISPPLEWHDPPADTASFALIVDDPDAPGGTWVHWVLYNLPAGIRNLSQAVPSDTSLTNGGLNGRNSWKRLGYGGPCPPGGTHRYYFMLYALDTVLELDGEPDKDQLVRAMEGHILAQTDLMGTYARK